MTGNALSSFWIFPYTNEISHASHAIPVMSKMPQATPVLLVMKKSLCFLRKTRKRHSDRNNPILSIQFPLLIQFLLLASLLRIFYHIKESQQCKYVRDNHQSIKEVGHIPNQIHLKHCTDDDANHNDCGV